MMRTVAGVFGTLLGLSAAAVMFGPLTWLDLLISALICPIIAIVLTITFETAKELLFQIKSRQTRWKIKTRGDSF